MSIPLGSKKSTSGERKNDLNVPLYHKSYEFLPLSYLWSLGQELCVLKEV